ncbi:hypothetical protein Tco_0856486 [Tanacetum coccineum]|uniref:Uncharacterized protein n=1 Tax=Tanacetum coccineum TaxID=301880 RepID=A0ABQ5B953_9ASTR
MESIAQYTLLAKRCQHVAALGFVNRGCALVGNDRISQLSAFCSQKGRGDEDTYDIVHSCQVKSTRILAGNRNQNGVCIPKLEEALYNNQFEQHWLQAENDRQVGRMAAVIRNLLELQYLDGDYITGNDLTSLALVQDLIPKSFEGPAQRRI